MRKWIIKGVLPIMILLLLLFIFKTIYTVNGTIDWFRLWMIIGIPFEFGRICILIFPRGYDLGATVGILALGVILSGFVGGIIALFTLIEAAYNLVILPVHAKCRKEYRI